MKRLLLASLLAAAGSACGLVDPPGAPQVMAHRAAAGNWPENSRTAVRGAVAANYPGIEFDIVLTADGVPVLSHDPWLHQTLCTHADGTPLVGERLLIKDLTLDALRTGYRCGGVADPEMPDAQVVSETHMTLDELFTEVATAPDMVLQFDIKYEDGLTLPAEDFVQQVVVAMRDSGLPNPWYVSSTEVDFIPLAVAAVPDGVDVSLTWPKFKQDDNSTVVGLSNELLAQLGLGDPLAIATRVGATGLLLQYRVTDRRIVEAAHQQGLSVQLWTLNTEGLLDAYCSWPVDKLITDYPERASCL
ncbi:MAG: hypothetical protein M3Y59_14945 [Myxococcota bacterium]|nr:hypothetical protein [Myxococcota bacterium]